MSTDDVSIQDPDDFTTSARLKQIFEARRDLRKMRREASRYRNSSKMRTKRQAVQHYRSGVESYLLEVDTLLHQFDPGPELWAEKHYGTIVVNPPGKWEKKSGYYRSKNMERGPNQPLKVNSIPEPKKVEIIGLKWLFEAESPVRRPFDFEVMSSMLDETVTKEGGAFISWNQLNEMVTDINTFLAEIGVGLSIDETDEWEI